MLDDFLNYRSWTLRAREEFQVIQFKLNEESLQRACLGLGKLLEECGQIFSAKSIYEKVSTFNISNKFLTHLRCQLLRIYVLEQSLSEVQTYYAACVIEKSTQAAKDYDIQHGLMHADVYLNGIQSGHERVKNILADPKIQSFEKRLIFFDFIFECFMRNEFGFLKTLNLSVFTYYELDSFEKCVFEIVSLLNQSDEIKTEQISKISCEELSLMSALRVLAMINKLKDTHNFEFKSRFKISILSQQLDFKTRELISTRWFNSEELKTLEFFNNQLIFDSKSLNISDHSVALKIIGQFCHKREFQTSELINHLYGCDYDEHSVNRLKVTISRLNSSLENVCGQKRAISVTKNKVILSDKIVIKCVS